MLINPKLEAENQPVELRLHLPPRGPSARGRQPDSRVVCFGHARGNYQVRAASAAAARLPFEPDEEQQRRNVQSADDPVERRADEAARGIKRALALLSVGFPLFLLSGIPSHLSEKRRRVVFIHSAPHRAFASINFPKLCVLLSTRSNRINGEPD